MKNGTSLKSRLNRSEKLYGFFVGIPSPAVVEMIGYVGFDFVILDAEHAPIDVAALEHMLRAADGADIHALVRVPDASAARIQHVLDLGAEGIMVPHVTDAETARDIVQRAYYPPLGTRGASTVARAARYGAGEAASFLRDRAGSTCVVAMIEDAVALPNVENIARVDGVDAVFIGPTDLSTSMGHPGEPGHPEVVAAIAGICTAARRVEGLTIATLGGSAEEARRLHGEGVNMLMYSPVKILVAGLKTLIGELQAL
jgi:4-hydroxy-2-oxoheptanedioate aldolase